MLFLHIPFQAPASHNRSSKERDARQENQASLSPDLQSWRIPMRSLYSATRCHIPSVRYRKCQKVNLYWDICKPVNIVCILPLFQASSPQGTVSQAALTRGNGSHDVVQQLCLSPHSLHLSLFSPTHTRTLSISLSNTLGLPSLGWKPDLENPQASISPNLTPQLS